MHRDRRDVGHLLTKRLCIDLCRIGTSRCCMRMP